MQSSLFVCYVFTHFKHNFDDCVEGVRCAFSLHVFYVIHMIRRISQKKETKGCKIIYCKRLIFLTMGNILMNILFTQSSTHIVDIEVCVCFLYIPFN